MGVYHVYSDTENPDSPQGTILVSRPRQCTPSNSAKRNSKRRCKDKTNTIPLLKFTRMLKDTTIKLNNDIRYQKDAVYALKAFIESIIHEALQKGHLLTLHRQKKIIKGNDIEFSTKLCNLTGQNPFIINPHVK